MNSPCSPPEFEEKPPCAKRAELHKKKLAEYEKMHPTTNRGIWAMFWCWAFNNCREETNDRT